MYDEDTLFHIGNGHSHQLRNIAFIDDPQSSFMDLHVKAEDLSEPRDEDAGHSNLVIWEIPGIDQISLPKHMA
jgi:hypothetical protein